MGTKVVVIQRALGGEGTAGTGFRGCTLEVRQGRFGTVQAIAGLGLEGEEVPILRVDDTQAKLPSFLADHYFYVLAEVECSAQTTLAFDDGVTQAAAALADVTEEPTLVDLGAGTRFRVFLHTSRQTGRLSITPTSTVAGFRQPYRLEYTTGPEGINSGGGIHILTPYSCWTAPFMDPGATVTVESATAVEWKAELNPFTAPAVGWVYSVRITRGRLSPGDRIALKYTDESGDGIQAQRYIQGAVPFSCWEDSQGNGCYHRLPSSHLPTVSVVAGPAERFRVNVPQHVLASQPLPLTGRALDACMNPVEDWQGEASLKVRDREGNLVLCDSMTFDHGVSSGHIPGLSGGLYVATLSCPGFLEENIVVSVGGAGDMRPYWGQIHGHSAVSDGEFSARDYFEYAKNIGLLDFCALTDHDWEILEHTRNRGSNGLEALGALTREYNVDGEFVTVCAYEWMGREGHINVYYLADSGNPIYLGIVSLLGGHKQYVSARSLLDQFRGRDDVLVLPHFSHGFAWTDYDPDLQPVAEIHSYWGCSEEKCVDGSPGAIHCLNEGKRFGFIGGADSHHGMPGQAGYGSKYRTLQHREGLACVMAPSLTRQDLFDALKARRCYATSGERILLEFEMDGHPMGSEIRVPQDASHLRARVLVGAVRPIQTIEVIRDGEPIAVDRPDEALIREWAPVLELGAEETSYYYVRVTQTDGERAWASPIWVSRAAPA